MKRPGRSIERSRAQAELLAKQVAAEASAHPERFQELVERHSDHADVLLGGDFGLWSSHEPSEREREIEAIAALKIGAVSEPIDGFEGFSIFLRSEATERPEFAVTYLRVRDGETSVPVAKLSEVQPLLRGHSRDFEKLRAKYCCATVYQWQQGRGDARIEQLVSALEVGAVAPRLIDHGQGFFHLYKRISPASRKSRERVNPGLPTPTRPDVDSLLAAATRGADLAKFIGAIRQSFGDGLGVELDAERQKRVSAVLDSFSEQIQSRPAEERVTLLNGIRAQLKGILSADEYAELQANVRSELSRRLMGPR